MYFRFTLFNGITLLILALTIWVLVARFRSKLDSNWFLAYYLLIIAYWRGFTGGLGTPWVAGGVLTAIALRFEFLGGIFITFFRVLEMFFLAYVILRCIGLLLMWPW